MPYAFVLMPFDEDFQVLYTDFVRPALKEAGFHVEKADDIESNRNILRDIIEGIAKSDLVVADLTGNNPNVLYELGLTHAMWKPVIHLTQTIEEVPFDLAPYRMFVYSRDFSKINEAKQKLAAKAKAAKEGVSPFGNPFTDFYRGATAQNLARQMPPDDATTLGRSLVTSDGPSLYPPTGETVATDERGFLDHLVDVNQNYAHVAQITDLLTNSIYGLAHDIEGATDELTRISANPNSSTPVAVRGVCRRLAKRFAIFNAEVVKTNAVYEESLENTEDSLEYLVSLQTAATSGTSPEIGEGIETLREVQEQISSARSQSLSFADTMDALPRAERHLNREIDATSGGIRVLASLLGRIEASISRAVIAGTNTV